MLTALRQAYSNLVSDQDFSEILTGSAWALSAQLIAIALGLISSVVIARLYGAEAMGIVAMLNSFLLLATTFTVLGTNVSILKLIPEHLFKYSPTSAFKLYRKIRYLVMGMSLGTTALLFLTSNTIASNVFNKPHLSIYFALGAMFILFKSLMDLNAEAVRGLKLIRLFTLMQILPQGFNISLLLLLGLFVSTVHVPVYSLLGSFAFTAIISLIILEFAFKKKMQPKDEVVDIPTGKVLSLSFPMLITVTMTLIIGQIGVMMLGMFRSDAEVGYYAVAIKLATITSFVLTAVNSIAAPKFSELYHSHNIDTLFCVARKSTRFIFWTTAPILIFLTIMGKFVLSFLFGEEFIAAYPPLIFLILGQFADSVSGSTGYFMNMTGNHKTFRNIMIAAAILNIFLNSALIPQFGIQGAALSGMTCMIFWNVSTLIYIKIKYGQTISYTPLSGS
jgi:O-antigen/teichoic acid export membrane protein